MGGFGDLRKANGGVDVITQNRFAGRRVAGKQTFDALPQGFLAKLLVANRARPDCLLEVASKGGMLILLFFPSFAIDPIRDRSVWILLLSFFRAAEEQND